MLIESRKGFTLIEIIVVVLIIAVFCGFSIAGYRQFERYKKIIAETKRLVEAFELAKKRTMTAEKRCSQMGKTDDGIWYKIKFYNSTGGTNGPDFIKYELQPAGVQPPDPECPLDFTYILPSNIKIVISLPAATNEAAFFLPIIEPFKRISPAFEIAVTDISFPIARCIKVEESGNINIYQRDCITYAE